MCVVVWQDDNGYQWYLGYVKKNIDGKLSVDHLARKLKASDSKWKYPSQEERKEWIKTEWFRVVGLSRKSMILKRADYFFR